MESDTRHPETLTIWQLCLLFLVMVADGADAQSLAIAGPVIMAEWGAPLAALTPSFVCTSAGLVLGSVSAGWASDRYGGRRTMVLACVLAGAFNAAVPLAESIEILSLLRFFAGLGMGAAFTTVITIGTTRDATGSAATKTLLVYLGAPIGYYLCSVVGGELLRAGSWRTVFYVSGGLVFVLGIALAFVLPVRMDEAKRAQSQVKAGSIIDLFRMGQLPVTMVLWGTMLGGNIVVFLVSLWLPSLIILEGRSAGDAATISSFVFVGGIAGTLLLSNFVGGRRASLVVAGAYALAAVGLVALGALISEPGLLIFLPLGMVGMTIIGCGMSMNIVAAWCYAPEVRGRGVGCATAFGRVGSLIGPAVGGLMIADANLRPYIFPMLAVISVALAISLIALTQLRQRHVGQTELVSSPAT